MMLVIIMHPKQIIASQAEHSETDRYSWRAIATALRKRDNHNDSDTASVHNAFDSNNYNYL